MPVAMILAAGAGSRMRPLTNTTPKALVEVADKALIVYHLENLARAGVKKVVINLAYHGKQIEVALGDGEKWGLDITYSHETDMLGTGGGIYNALPLLGDAPFIIVNCDIFTDYAFENLKLSHNQLAHLVMVDNPSHNPSGDFQLKEGHVFESENDRLTYAGIAMFAPGLFADCRPGKFSLKHVLQAAIAAEKLTGEHFYGRWVDVGTPERLLEVKALLKDRI